ncbi:bifunctional molybdenum cofactor biosynthesis protein MoaC/MoaB [Pontibacter sp. SGAir0037]|uniref:bifunctional molybdenum cofactor biosynthesis protein MoaC/MoaB n=1 Tax=Pontibacter sp. SGAir0037 TaxID=2571030 RepID=UPI0010CCC86E|nr:bifunctional molybdenum cofactor biosynthesis protein MoaC/MoaB [Pontibacter sp. SGAir0037]QCR22877.1 bifunctional molybdenum cofactor biosynthesis protein MoaC/MoaB [Pontibacter sp. SGAir0037]
MHDLTSQSTALQTAQAIGVVFCTAETIALLEQGGLPGGSPFSLARAAGFIGAKATPQLLPQRHAIQLDSLQLEFETLQEELHKGILEEGVLQRSGILIKAVGKAIGRAGIETEVLTAVSVAALELFDLLKTVDAQLEIGQLRALEQKKKKYFNTPPVCAVLVCSDSTAAGEREDNSGKIIMQMLEEVNAEVKHYLVLPDDKAQIQQQIKKWVEEDVQFIFTTGGTGLGPRDNTVSAVKEMLERDADGIAEAIRVHGQMRTPLAMMSRGVAGAIGHTLVVTLPGSSNGVRESLEAILPAVFHARKMMKGGGH